MTKPIKSTQPYIRLGSLNQVPALIGWGKEENVTYAEWQTTLGDPMRVPVVVRHIWKLLFSILGVGLCCLIISILLINIK